MGSWMRHEDTTTRDKFAGYVREPNHVVHVLPENDALPHREGMDCECRPRLELVPPNGAVIVHNAWDGREAYE